MKTTLIIACGALAHEIVAVLKANSWSHVDVTCLPAEWHNTPEKIAPAIEQKIHEHKNDYQSILIGYGDCGSGGKLDHLLEAEGVERLPGAHCYSFFSGLDQFAELAEDEIGTFYLTDYLAANFDRLILRDLGIEKHPELADMYFGNYKKLVYLSQQQDSSLLDKARAAAEKLGLNFEHVHTGLAPLTQSFRDIKIEAHTG